MVGIELGMDAVDGSDAVVGVPMLDAILGGAVVADDDCVLEVVATMSHDCVGVYASFSLDVVRPLFPEGLSVEMLLLEDMLYVRT